MNSAVQRQIVWSQQNLASGVGIAIQNSIFAQTAFGSGGNSADHHFISSDHDNQKHVSTLSLSQLPLGPLVESDCLEVYGDNFLH